MSERIGVGERVELVPSARFMDSFVSRGTVVETPDHLIHQGGYLIRMDGRNSNSIFHQKSVRRLSILDLIAEAAHEGR